MLDVRGEDDDISFLQEMLSIFDNLFDLSFHHDHQLLLGMLVEGKKGVGLDAQKADQGIPPGYQTG